MKTIAMVFTMLIAYAAIAQRPDTAEAGRVQNPHKVAPPLSAAEKHCQPLSVKKYNDCLELEYQFNESDIKNVPAQCHPPRDEDWDNYMKTTLYNECFESRIAFNRQKRWKIFDKCGGYDAYGSDTKTFKACVQKEMKADSTP